MRFVRPKSLSYQETIRFHGHDGPFLALGYKLGRFVVKTFRPKGIMDFKITVRTRAKKPFTCLIDGLQCITFATTGKANMLIKKCRSKDIIVFVENNKRKYRYKITQKAMNICLNADDLHKAAQKIFRTPAKDLWNIL